MSDDTEKRIRLSPKQAEVMKWLQGGWCLYGQGPFSSIVTVNGERICNVDTMIALERRGLAREELIQSGRWPVSTWIATEEGKAWTP